jgi:galactoside O-acetyltransferase
MEAMVSNFYNEAELKELGLKSFGKNVLISRRCSIYGTGNISLGNNVRIDDFCILSGKISTGDYIHIAAGVKLYASAGLKIGNFCGISANSCIYTAVDDFSGEFMISPMVPEELTNPSKGEVVLEDFVQLGANTIITPGLKLKEGAVTGAMSFVNRGLDPWTINFGIPCRFYKTRSMNAKELTKRIGK